MSELFFTHTKDGNVSVCGVNFTINEIKSYEDFIAYDLPTEVKARGGHTAIYHPGVDLIFFSDTEQFVLYDEENKWIVRWEIADKIINKLQELKLYIDNKKIEELKNSELIKVENENPVIEEKPISLFDAKNSALIKLLNLVILQKSQYRTINNEFIYDTKLKEAESFTVDSNLNDFPYLKIESEITGLTPAQCVQVIKQKANEAKGYDIIIEKNRRIIKTKITNASSVSEVNSSFDGIEWPFVILN